MKKLLGKLLLLSILFYGNAHAQAVLTINISAGDLTTAAAACQVANNFASPCSNAQLKTWAILILTNAVLAQQKQAVWQAVVVPTPIAPN